MVLLVFSYSKGIACSVKYTYHALAPELVHKVRQRSHLRQCDAGQPIDAITHMMIGKQPCCQSVKYAPSFGSTHRLPLSMVASMLSGCWRKDTRCRRASCHCAISNHPSSCMTIASCFYIIKAVGLKEHSRRLLDSTARPAAEDCLPI